MRIRVFDEFPVEERFTLTLLMDVSNQQAPLFITLNDGTNGGNHFLTFVCDAIQHGYVRAGDYLIVDNAPGHVSRETLHQVRAALAAVGADLVRLPTHSPELNPVELCFAFLKGLLGRHEFVHLDLRTRVKHILSQLPWWTTMKFMSHCTGTALRMLNGEQVL